MDHFQVRGWQCVHRHIYRTTLCVLFCGRTRRRLDEDDTLALTVEQVRHAVNAYVVRRHLLSVLRHEASQQELKRPRYHQSRNAQAKKSRTTTRDQFSHDLGIDVDAINVCAAWRRIEQEPYFTEWNVKRSDFQPD